MNLFLSSKILFLGRKRIQAWWVASVQFSHSVMSDSLQPHGLQHNRPPCPSPTPGVYPGSCPLSRWCHPTISSSGVPFSSCLQSFPTTGSFPVSQFFTSGGQNIGASASASVLPMNIQDWFLRMDWFDFLAVQGALKSLLQHHNSKHQFFCTQPSLWSNSHIHTWLLDVALTVALTIRTILQLWHILTICQQSDVSAF